MECYGNILTSHITVGEILPLYQLNFISLCRVRQCLDEFHGSIDSHNLFLRVITLVFGCSNEAEFVRPSKDRVVRLIIGSQQMMALHLMSTLARV